MKNEREKWTGRFRGGYCCDLVQVTVSWSNRHVFDCFLFLSASFAILYRMMLLLTGQLLEKLRFSVLAHTSGRTWAVDDRQPAMFRAVDLRRFVEFRAELVPINTARNSAFDDVLTFCISQLCLEISMLFGFTLYPG